jgi:diguanylate cyclase (GGDEF)-like protein
MSSGPVVRDEALFKDRLTGLPNRRAFLAALHEKVPAGHGALVMLDLDSFQRVSKGLSRKRIERLLTDMAGRLRAAAGPDALLYRYAGDAFCMLLPGADRDRAAAAAETLRAAVARGPMSLGDPGGTMVSVALTASAAVAAYPIDGRSPTVLIETAEMALLVAKHQGRNRVAVAGRLDPAALAEIGIFRGLPCPVLVGRVAEQSKLRQLASDVRPVGPSFALLTGPPGIGKTRLLRELCRWGRAERFVVLRGTCQEARSTLPYAALAEPIENLMAADRASALEAIGRLGSAHRMALSVVVRSFPAGESVPGLDLNDYGKLVFAAFVAILEELAKAGPLLVSLDEAEFADAPTFEVLRAAVERRLPLLLAATTDHEVSEFGRTPAGAFFQEQKSSVHIPLGPLTPDEMGQVLQSILPEADIAAGSGDQILEVSKGNPLYLEETVRSLLQKGRVKLQSGKWSIPPLGPDDLPADLAGAIRAVTESLPARAHSILTGAAVIGSEVDPELLQEVLGQDEMEMLDLIDEARRARLLVTSETGQELLAFPAAHSRRLRLDSSDGTKRKELHGRVGVVQEARHGGDVAHMADELAWHYGKAGNESRAQHFDAVARKRAELIEPPRREGARRVRIPSIHEALSPAAQDHAFAMMRHFAGVLKVGRLYPQWSQVSTSFLAQLQEAFRAMLAASGAGVTIAALPAGPALNGTAVDAAAAADFVALMDDRLIESITVLRTFDVSRLDVLVRTFGEPFDRVRAAADHWERFIERERLEGLDIAQKAYQARDRDRKGAIVKGEEPVPPDHLPALRDALRALKAAADNLKLYPPGHSLVEESAREVTRLVLGFLDRVPALTLGTAEGELVVNGAPGDRKFFGDAGAFVVREVDQRALKSVSIWKGLPGDEVLGLVSFLSIPKGEPAKAEQLLKQFTHVAFGSRQYERAEEGTVTVRLSPPPRAIRSELRARALLDQPYGQFISLDLDEQYPVLVEALAYGAGRPVAEELVDRLATHFHDADVDHRRQAYQLLARSIAFSSPTTRKVQISRSAPPLTQRLREDTVPEAFRAAADILPFWIPAAATVGCLRELAEVTGKALRPRADDPESNAEIAAAAEASIQVIPDSAAFPLIVAAVRKVQEWERQPAIQILVAVGGTAIGQLIEIIAEEPDLFVRQAVATELAPTAAEVGSELAQFFSKKVPAERLGRILEVVAPLLSPGVQNLFSDLVEKGAPEVRREILRAAEKWPRAAVVPIVRRLLGSPGPGNRDLGIEAAARMKVEQVSAEIGRLLEEAQDERLMIQCCTYFAAVVNPVAVPALTRIVDRRPRLFGMLKGLSAEARAAAVRALEKQATPTAQEAAQAGLKDTRIRKILGR